jgi:DnaJ-class molecular chaperone
MTDPYRTLGVSKSSSDAEIKKAYRNLAKKLHPDTNQGNEKIAERFKSVSAAYSLVGDKKKRAQFDGGEIDDNGNPTGFSGGGSPFGNRGGNPFGGGGGFGGGGAGVNPEDILGSMFGGGFDGATRARGTGSGRGGVMRGKDRIYEIYIGLHDAYEGLKKKITLDNGKTLNVTIPKGVGEGQQIRLKGQGDLGRFGGAAGDALIEIKINPHAYFKLEGNDIHLDLPITIKEALLGGKVNVPTLNGTVTLTIPKNTSSGKIMRLKGRGFSSAKSPEGHQFVKFMIMLPEESDQQLENLVKVMGDDWDKNFAAKIRDKF